MALYHPEFRFIEIGRNEAPPEGFTGSGHYVRGANSEAARVALTKRYPPIPGNVYVLDTRHVPWKPALIVPRPIVKETGLVWPVENLTVFLGHLGANFDLYGDPETGDVFTRPVAAGCKTTKHGSRSHFFSTRARSPHIMRLTEAGKEW